MKAVILGKRHVVGEKDGRSYNYDKIVYGVPDEDGYGLTVDDVSLDHTKEHGQLPLFVPVGLRVGMKYGKLKVVGFDIDAVDDDPLLDSIVDSMRTGRGELPLPEDWDV